MIQSFSEQQAELEHYFRNAKKPNEKTHRVGMEIEVMCVHQRTGMRIAYDDRSDANVRLILESLMERFEGEAITEGEYLIGYQAENGQVTIEPGGQIEWSSPPELSLSELSFRLTQWVEGFNKELTGRNVRPTTHAFDTHTIKSEIPWVPKLRYETMRAKYRDNSDFTDPAMGNTAGIHVAIDFANELDWEKKFKASVLLTPVVVALFANSPAVNKFGHFASWRPMLWDSFDKARCRFPKEVFNTRFDLGDWSQWLASVPHMFDQPHAEGLVQQSSGKATTLRDHLPSNMRNHLSSIFTPIRTNQYLELRMMDMQPFDDLLNVPAFWMGVLYSHEILDQVLDQFSAINDYKAWHRMFYRACHHGLADPALAKLAGTAVKLASAGLTEFEDGYRFAMPLWEYLQRKLAYPKGKTSVEFAG